MHCPDGGLRAGRAAPTTGMAAARRRGGIGKGLAMARTLMGTLCRVMAAQHRHADAAGVRVSLAVPDSRRMAAEPPAPLSRALPALLRAAIGAVAPGGTVEIRVEGVTS